MFKRAELELIRDLCVRWNCLAITDEIYEYMLYDGAEHISIATLDGMRERTVTINALSKTYSVTGWRVGWAIAPPESMDISFGIFYQANEASRRIVRPPSSFIPQAIFSEKSCSTHEHKHNLLHRSY